MKELQISIVLPCYNEAKGLEALLKRYATVGAGHDFELILVDNGSKDDTQAVLADLLPQYPFARCHQVINNKGYGDGIWQGLREARGTYVAWSHADLQTDGADVFRAVALLQQSPAPERVLVKGVRSGRSLSECIVTRGMQLFATVVLRRYFHEINAQPKVFHRDLLTYITNPPVDFNFDVYVLYCAKRAGWRLASIPVQFPPRQHGHSNWSRTWASKFRTIRRSMLFMCKLGFGCWPSKPPVTTTHAP